MVKFLCHSVLHLQSSPCIFCFRATLHLHLFCYNCSMTGMVQIGNRRGAVCGANPGVLLHEAKMLAAHRGQEAVLRSDLRDSVVDCGSPLPLLSKSCLPKRQRTGALHNLAETRSRFMEREGSLRDLTRFNANFHLTKHNPTIHGRLAVAAPLAINRRSAAEVRALPTARQEPRPTIRKWRISICEWDRTPHPLTLALSLPFVRPSWAFVPQGGTNSFRRFPNGSSLPARRREREILLGRIPGVAN
jgi:hypothetical protein